MVRGTAEGGARRCSTRSAAKVLAGIDTGKLPDTIRDRAIVIGLERKRAARRSSASRSRDIADQIDGAARPARGLGGRAHDEQLASYRCEPLPAISERLEEAWEPLLAIAELAGGDWPKARATAAVALARGAEDAGEDHGQLLLAALKEIFGEREAMFTKDICTALNEDDELPFGGYRKDEGIDGRGLARMLKPYGIKPKTIEYAGKKRRATGASRSWRRGSDMRRARGRR